MQALALIEAVAMRIDQGVVAAVVDEARLACKARRVHPRAFRRGAKARDRVGAFRAAGTPGDRNHAARQRARERELRHLAGWGVACYGDLTTARDNVERSGTFNAMVRGEQLLATDHGCGAQQVMANKLNDVAADSASGTCRASPRMGIATAQNKGAADAAKIKARAET